jgi:hypothetical protein
MAPITRTFYYFSYNKEEDKNLILPNSTGSTWNTTIPLYANEKLTEKIGSFVSYSSLLDNSKQTPVLDKEQTVVTSEGTINYQYVRNSYKPITIDTELTSGIFTKGTITRSYVTADKSVRKLVYRSAE